MNFFNHWQKKYKNKLIHKSYEKESAFLTRKLLINNEQTKITIFRIINNENLLNYFGLNNEYNIFNGCVILAKKFKNTKNFKLPYCLIFCNYNWKVIQTAIIEPNKNINKIKDCEYIFIFAPNTAQELQIKIGDILYPKK